MGTLPYDGIGVEGLQLNKPQKIASPFILVSHLHQLLTYGHFQNSTAVLQCFFLDGMSAFCPLTRVPLLVQSGDAAPASSSGGKKSPRSHHAWRERGEPIFVVRHICVFRIISPEPTYLNKNSFQRSIISMISFNEQPSGETSERRENCYRQQPPLIMVISS